MSPAAAPSWEARPPSSPVEMVVPEGVLPRDMSATLAVLEEERLAEEVPEKKQPLPEQKPAPEETAPPEKTAAPEEKPAEKKQAKELTFERPLSMWLPYNSLPLAAVLHEHETLELRKIRGTGRLVAHAHSDQGDPLFVGAVLLDTAAMLVPGEPKLPKREFPHQPRVTFSFSAEPTQDVTWDLLFDDAFPEDKGGLHVEFAIVARFQDQHRKTSETGYSEHPVRRLFGNLRQQERRTHETKLPSINYHSPGGALRTARQSQSRMSSRSTKKEAFDVPSMLTIPQQQREEEWKTPPLSSASSRSHHSRNNTYRRTSAAVFPP